MDIAQQFLRAGLVDEIEIHLIPVLAGSDLCLFDHLGTYAIELETTRVIASTGVTDLRYRVFR